MAMITRRIVASHGGRIRAATASVSRRSVQLTGHHLHQQRQSFALHGGSRRSIVSMYKISSFMVDVARTRSLQPPNPILDSLNGNDETDKRKRLPHFDRILPYHLDSAAPEIANQYKVDLAELEVSILNNRNQDVDLLKALDLIEAPVYQVMEIGRLMSTLTTSDDKRQWVLAFPNAEQALQGLPKRDSKVIYEALKAQKNTPPSVLATFERNGAHITQQNDERAKFEAMSNKLNEARDRLRGTPEFGQMTKQEQLRAISDIYNIVGLSGAQAKTLGYDSVPAMESAFEKRHATVEAVQDMNDGLLAAFAPVLDDKLGLDAESSAAAFLSSSYQKDKAPVLTDQDKVYLEAKWSVRKLLTLEGVLRGTFDLCDGLFGIKIVEETDKIERHGWDIDERLFHVYDTDSTPATTSAQSGVNDGEEDHGKYLGSFFLDPYERFDKEEYSEATLFTKRTHPTGAALAIIAMNAQKPMWSDDPSPLTWKDTHNFMFQFGCSLQMILSTADVSSLGQEGAASTIPVDHTNFLGHFMSLWLRNDGFLRRLANLSQDEYEFEQHIINILLREQRKEKAEDLMYRVFLSALELELYTKFDMKEPLDELQQRLAEKYLSHAPPPLGNLTPLLDVFDNPGKRIWQSYSSVWSEVVGTNLYDEFQRNNQSAYKQLGRKVRELAQRGTGSPGISTDVFQAVYEIE